MRWYVFLSSVSGIDPSTSSTTEDSRDFEDIPEVELQVEMEHENISEAPLDSQNEFSVGENPADKRRETSNSQLNTEINLPQTPVLVEEIVQSGTTSVHSTNLKDDILGVLKEVINGEILKGEKDDFANAIAEKVVDKMNKSSSSKEKKKDFCWSIWSLWNMPKA